MTVGALALAYVGVGALLALVAVVTRRASALDAALLLGLWPLYAPVLAGGEAGPAAATAPDEPALLAVLRRAAALPRVGALVGGIAAPARAWALGAQLQAGRARQRELEVALAQPALAPPAGAAAPAWRRAAIHDLRARRDRGAAALAVIDRIVGELATAVEVARLAGPADDAIAELAAALAAHIAELEALGGNEADAAGVGWP